MKGLSPLMATVMLIAFTLAVAALIGSWVTSMVKTETNIVESGATEQINCSSGILDIVSVICDNSSEELKISVQNLGTIELYDFSIVAKINNTFYTNDTYANSSVAPNSTDPLDPGAQYVFVCGCNSTYCPGGAEVTLIRISPGNCPQAYSEDSNVGVTCAP